MSKSYRKHPGYTGKDSDGKKFASRAVRRYRKYIPDGKFYRKLYESYNICDYKNLIWGKMDLRHAQRPEDWFLLPPFPVECFSELKKSKEYIKARMK